MGPIEEVGIDWEGSGALEELIHRKSFGRTLHMYRKRGKYSQAGLARAMGLDHSIVSRWEAGTREPTRKSVLTAISVLNLEPADADTLLMSAGFLPVDTSTVSVEVMHAVIMLTRQIRREVKQELKDELVSSLLNTEG